VSRVFPHQFPRVNNVFRARQSGLAAAPRGPTSTRRTSSSTGRRAPGVDDLYTPEITLNPPAVTTTNSFSLTMAYDDMKVAAIVNEINGFDHTGTTRVGTPTLFGMNFQAVSVGQKLKVEQLPTAPLLSGGYLDAAGTPSDGLQAALDHTDQSIGAMVSALEAQGLADSTLIIISAKHGNSPVDPATLVRVNPVVISHHRQCRRARVARATERRHRGPLIWLKDQTRTVDVVAALNQPANRAAARVAQVLSGDESDGALCRSGHRLAHARHHPVADAGHGVYDELRRRLPITAASATMTCTWRFVLVSNTGLSHKTIEIRWRRGRSPVTILKAGSRWSAMASLQNRWNRRSSCRTRTTSTLKYTPAGAERLARARPAPFARLGSAGAIGGLPVRGS